MNVARNANYGSLSLSHTHCDNERMWKSQSPHSKQSCPYISKQHTHTCSRVIKGFDTKVQGLILADSLTVCKDICFVRAYITQVQ